jgi:uncharacterized protein (TIGR02246 family)
VNRSAWASLALVSVVLGVAWWLSRRPEPPRAQAPPPPPPLDINEVKATIDRANAECVAALERGDAKAYARHFTEDSISLPGRGPMVLGRPAIEEAMSEAFNRVQFEDAEWRTLETRLQGRTAFETGAYKFVVRPYGKGRPQEQAGRYFVVWKRVGDEWQIAVDAAQPGAPVE